MNSTETTLSASLNEAYPIFEPNQLLTSKHLNELRSYLDNQDRLTRVKLIGIGIVCGLEVRYQSDRITITKGTGITSDGFLVHMAETSYGKCAKNLFVPEPPYAPFTKNGQLKKAIPLWELLPDDSEEEAVINFSTPTGKGFLKDKVVLVFVEIKDIDLEACVGQNCDDKGKNREITLRKLLVDCEVAAELVKESYGIKKKSEVAWIKRYEPTYMRMPRFGVKDCRKLKEVEEVNFDGEVIGDSAGYEKRRGFWAENLPDEAAKLEFDERDIRSNKKRAFNCDERTFIELYFNLFKSGKIQDEFFENVKQLYAVYQPVLDQDVSFNEVNGIYEKLTEHFAFVQDKIAIQYFYDFYKDIIKGYNELVDLGFEILAECCPTDYDFPRHLLLGKVVPEDTTCPEKSCLPSLFRTHFIQSPLYNLQKENIAKYRRYFRRLLVMVYNLDLERLEKLPLKITPSDEKQALLEKRSIPFYYKIEGLYPYWNHTLSKKCKENWNLAYFAEEYKNAPEPVLAPLLYETDAYNFYRIEGIQNANDDLLLNELEQMRKCYLLDFDIKFLYLCLPDKEIKEEADGVKRIDEVQRLKRLPQANCGLEEAQLAYLEVRNEIIAEMNEYNTLMVNVYIILAEINRLLAAADNKMAYAEMTHGHSQEMVYNQLVKGHIPQINAVIETLPYCAEDFDFEAFQLAHKELVKFALNVLAAIEFLHTVNPSYALMLPFYIDKALLQRGVAASYDDLYAVFRNQSEVRLISVHKRYMRKKAEAEQAKLFRNFVRYNPKIDRMSGVPKGGTFIVLCDNTGRVLGDYAMHGKACCCPPADRNCEAPYAYPPVAPTLFRILTELPEGGMIELDALNHAFDLNITELDLKPYPEKTVSEMGIPIEVKMNSKYARNTIHYGPFTMPDNTKNVVDHFQYEVVHTSHPHLNAIGEVVIMLIPPRKDSGGVVTGGTDVVGTPTHSGVWKHGKERLKVSDYYDNMIEEEVHIAKDLYDDTHAVYDYFGDKDPVEATTSAEVKREHEKEVTEKLGEVMKKTVESIEKLDRYIGPEPEDLDEKLKFRMENSSDLAKRDALVALHENQVETLTKLVVKEKLIEEEDGELFKFMDKEVRGFKNSMEKHSATTERSVKALSVDESLSGTAKELFKSF